MSDTGKKKGSKKGRTSITLCLLDKKTKLVASDHSFVIKERVKTKETGEISWVGKYFYSDVIDAVKGYARHFLRKPELADKLDGSVEALIKVLLELDKSIAESALKMKEEYVNKVTKDIDPVDAVIEAKP